MIFLDPTSDLVFKKLFGNAAHKNIIISFLNSVLGKTEADNIVDVTFSDTHNIPETYDSKHSIVGIRCTDGKGLHYIVEMQVLKQHDYLERSQYYSALALSRQLKKKQEYHNLVPVIFVGILCFDLFKNPDYVSHHVILDTQTHEHALKHLEFHFVELSKFDKQLEEVSTILDKWIYLLKNASDMKSVPGSFKQEADVQDALDLLEQGNWSTAELEAYDRYWDAIRSSASQLQTARMDGITEGKLEGRLEGISEGRLEGKFEAMRAIAKGLRGILDVATISKKTGLTIDEIEKL